MKNIKNIYDIEKDLVDQDPHKRTKFLKKWQSVECPITQFNTRLSKTIQKVRCNFTFSLLLLYYFIAIAGG